MLQNYLRIALGIALLTVSVRAAQAASPTPSAASVLNSLRAE